jgi:hypothetical protein
MHSINRWKIAAFANFCVAAIIGLLLRSVPFVDMPWLNFRHMTHAHSHAAMMGWLYMSVFGLILHDFLPDTEHTKPKYARLFGLLQLAVIGMVVSFPFQGYGAVSITFSAIHLFGSYAFVGMVWKHLSHTSEQPRLMLRTAFVLMIFSNLGIYALGPATAIFGRFSNYYDLCIQFFLHFQFQGWFFFVPSGTNSQWFSHRGHRYPPC